ncbi:MAG: hypothetical protein L3J09_02905 [Flavobacteriaceae bacterium]|nr:hypothetical protein [Flavobacteriaceae bacterium]
MKTKYLLITIIGFLFITNANAQYVTTKVKDKHQQYTDSLKQVEYKCICPILGQGAYKKGVEIPYPIGAMENFMWIDQEITIANLQLGLKTNNQEFNLQLK